MCSKTTGSTHHIISRDYSIFPVAAVPMILILLFQGWQRLIILDLRQILRDAILFSQRETVSLIVVVVRSPLYWNVRVRVLYEELIVLFKELFLTLSHERIGDEGLVGAAEEEDFEHLVQVTLIDCCIQIEILSNDLANAFQVLISGEVQPNNLEMIQAQNSDEADKL